MRIQDPELRLARLYVGLQEFWLIEQFVDVRANDFVLLRSSDNFVQCHLQGQALRPGIGVWPDGGAGRRFVKFRDPNRFTKLVVQNLQRRLPIACPWDAAVSAVEVVSRNVIGSRLRSVSPGSRYRDWCPHVGWFPPCFV